LIIISTKLTTYALAAAQFTDKSLKSLFLTRIYKYLIEAKMLLRDFFNRTPSAVHKRKLLTFSQLFGSILCNSLQCVLTVQQWLYFYNTRHMESQSQIPLEIPNPLLILNTSAPLQHWLHLLFKSLIPNSQMNACADFEKSETSELILRLHISFSFYYYSLILIQILLNFECVRIGDWVPLVNFGILHISRRVVN